MKSKSEQELHFVFMLKTSVRYFGMSTVTQAMAHGLRAQEAGRFGLGYSVDAVTVQEVASGPVSTNAWDHLSWIHARQNRVDVAALGVSQSLRIGPIRAFELWGPARCARRNSAYPMACERPDGIAVEERSASLYFEHGRVVAKLQQYDAAPESFVMANQLRVEEVPEATETVLPWMHLQTWCSAISSMDGVGHG